MNGRSTGVVALLGGAALIYLAYTGYLGSAWNGITGKCSGASNAASPTEQKAKGTQTGGQVDVSASARGTYYPSVSGALMAGDGGAW